MGCDFIDPNIEFNALRSIAEFRYILYFNIQGINSLTTNL